MADKLPVGIQDFESLRTNGYAYVDKTEYIYRLVHEGKPYFLSRPRRFGKSLLLSTMRAYWEGRKDLFSGLAIERLEENNPKTWQPYPVFYFDFNGESYEETSIEEVLDQHLSEWERVFGGFFSILKSLDEYIQFVFITGVSQYHKVSLGNAMNQLNDISINEEYSGICGITEEEMQTYFENEINQLAANKGQTRDSCLAQVRCTYGGYRFHPDGESGYNPFSLLLAFADREYGSYWFETGTPTFLIKKFYDNQFDVRRYTDDTLYAGMSQLKCYTGDDGDLVSWLLQIGQK